MKAFILLVVMLWAFTASAVQNRYEPIRASIANLSRHFQITLEGETHEVGIIENDYNSAYYATLESGLVLLQIWEASTEDKDLELLIYADDHMYKFKLPHGQRTGVLKGIKVAKKHGRSLITSNNMLYWYNFDYNEWDGATAAEVTLATPVTSRQSISQHITVTGPMNFNPCDGCEHGDQLMIENVNVVNMDFGMYYEADCEGKLARLFERLLSDEGLAVPFTYVGRVNYDSGDLVEDFESHWVADHFGGQLYIGTTKKLPFRLFLDSLIHRSAFTLGVEVASIERDVMNKGKFVSYQDGVLTFTYKSVIIRTNLLTGQTL